MNGDWFGDSYDVVKRFFAEVLTSMGHAVYVDPMPTGEWASTEHGYLHFLRVQHIRDFTSDHKSALLLDPNTGVGKPSSRDHVTIEYIVRRLETHEVVWAFDQSISRSGDPLPQLQEKLRMLAEHGAHGFYYDSHARFLFASRSPSGLRALEEALLATGLPSSRLVHQNELRRPC